MLGGHGPATPFELGLLHGLADRNSGWRGPFLGTPHYADQDGLEAEQYERGYTLVGAGF